MRGEYVKETRRFQRAARLDRLPPYLFVELETAKHELVDRGVDLVDLGLGDPDLPTFPEIVEALREAAGDPATHCYPSQRGDRSLRDAIARWFESRHGVALDPDREIHVLIGTKEGLGHLPVAVLDEDRVALVPDPGYPVYQASSWLVGGDVVHVPLEPELGFRPDLERLPRKTMEAAQLLYLNYPNNPTGAAADAEFFQLAVNLAHEHDFVVVNDAAYAEIVYEGHRASLLAAGGAADVAVEFHSFSKTFNMTGWRVGFVAGNADVIDALSAVKSNMDSCVFTAVQRAAEAALALPVDRVQEQVDVYRRRRDTLVDGLWEAGWRVPRPHATFYVWAKVPTDEDSRTFARRLLTEARVVVTPGVGFGASGEGYVRMALTTPEARIAEAVERIRGAL
jgi:LL-diaminopimelate aminotransferase